MYGKENRRGLSKGWLAPFLVALLALVWVGAAMAASEVFLNDSGAVVRAIRITFSEPVEITGFGDTFDYQSPKGKATTFVFTGTPLDEWWTFWISWNPDSASVVKTEWLKTGGGVQLDINIGDEPPTLDPSRIDGLDTPSLWVVEQLFMGLVDYNEHGTIIPELATSWESSSDATVWTFTLRDDVTWSDGVPVTAEDVRCGFLRALDPEHPYPYLYVFDAICGVKAYYTGETSNLDDIGVEVLGTYRIQFTLDQPASYFPALAVNWPFWAVPKHVVDAVGDAWTEPKNIVTDGPYRLVKWVYDNHIALEKNEAYYAASDVQIERVLLWKFDSEEAWHKYVSGLLDTEDITTERLDQIRGDPILAEQVRTVPRHQTFFGTGTYLYGFNGKLPPFDNLLVRKAFIMAVDRKGVMKAATSAGLITFPELALTLVPPGISGHVNSGDEGLGISYNPNKARQWLVEAGYPGGKGLPPITLWFDESPLHNAVASYVCRCWTENLRVEVDRKGTPRHDYIEQLNSGQYQVCRLGWVPDYPDSYSSLHDLINFPLVHIRGALGGWIDSNYDKLVDRLSREQQPAVRISLCTQAERILVETDAVIMPLFYYGAAIVTKPYLERTFPSFGAPDIAKWRLLPADRPCP